MTLDIILSELDELGARIDALSGLGAAIAAALDNEVLRHGDVQNMLATYARGLLALQRRFETPSTPRRRPARHLPHHRQRHGYRGLDQTAWRPAL